MSAAWSISWIRTSSTMRSPSANTFGAREIRAPCSPGGPGEADAVAVGRQADHDGQLGGKLGEELGLEAAVRGIDVGAGRAPEDLGGLGERRGAHPFAPFVVCTTGTTTSGPAQEMPDGALVLKSQMPRWT